jgi:hypothetical protein
MKIFIKKKKRTKIKIKKDDDDDDDFTLININYFQVIYLNYLVLSREENKLIQAELKPIFISSLIQ